MKSEDVRDMDFPERVKGLPQKELSWRDKLLLSGLVGFTFAFTFIFYGFIDVFAVNHAEIPLQFTTVLLVAFCVFTLVWLIVSGITLAFPGKLFPVVLSLTLGLLLAGYLQGTFLNLNLGELTGDAIPWEQYWRYGLINSLIWLVVLALPLVARRFSVVIWRKALIIVCVLLCGMQGAALMSTLLTTRVTEPKAMNAFLSAQGEYEVSSENNILVFIIDRLDYNYIDAVRQDDPAFFDRLDGFTEFDNSTALYCQTYPSATYMITNIKGFLDKPSKDYFDEAWKGSSAIPLLRENNYTTKFHIDYGYVYNDANQLAGKADNLRFGKGNPQWGKIAGNFIDLVLYRCAPHVFKAGLWIDQVDFTEDVEFDAPEDELVTANDPLFYEGLVRDGLTVQHEKNNYLFLHLNGSHAPYTMDENAQYTGNSDLVAQTKGSFHILFTYMDEMKKLGLYKDATIVITGDHGKSQDITPLDYASCVGFFVKPRGSAGTPLTQSSAPVSHENLLPTILQSEGLDHASYGVSAFDVPEDADVIRHFYYHLYQSSGNVLEHFEIRGNARDFGNWRKVEELPVLYLP
ncbi:MAG: hypothetical protein FWF88_02480 [Peptococcaceae bacterium]|nr:hypothetical protein [Peptococcaceae bacterium]